MGVSVHRFVQIYICVFFVKQKTAYEMRISDWSSDVCSSDLEIREWNESQSNSMLKAKGGSNKATGIALIVATVAGLGFVYWLNNSGDSKATALGRASCRERVCKYV